MKNQPNIISKMLSGFVPLESYTQNLNLSLSQKCKLQAYRFAIALFRIFVLPFRKKQTAQIEKELQKCTNMQIKIPRYKLPQEENSHFLSEEEIQDFEQKGLIGPFRVISKEEAARIEAFSQEAFKNGFDGELFIKGELEDSLRKHGQLHIGLAGLYQALRYKKLRDILKAPQIAHRLASILGPEVICWRSQFFQKNPGDQGTFWHQTGAFREVSKHDKLIPTQTVSHGILQLTTWVALTDVTIETSALRIMPGSFQDGRIEYLQGYVQDNLIDYLSRLPKESLPRLLKAALFTSGSFIRSQALFETIPLFLTDLFEEMEVVNLEMKAGEAAIFTSMNLHASFPNSSENSSRLALAGRYTANHVKVFSGMDKSYQATPDGIKSFSLKNISNIQVYGTDSYGFNRILKEDVA